MIKAADYEHHNFRVFTTVFFTIRRSAIVELGTHGTGASQAAAVSLAALEEQGVASVLPSTVGWCQHRCQRRQHKRRWGQWRCCWWRRQRRWRCVRLWQRQLPRACARMSQRQRSHHTHTSSFRVLGNNQTKRTKKKGKACESPAPKCGACAACLRGCGTCGTFEAGIPGSIFLAKAGSRAGHVETATRTNPQARHFKAGPQWTPGMPDFVGDLYEPRTNNQPKALWIAALGIPMAGVCCGVLKSGRP